jgi:hypothetical protein
MTFDPYPDPRPSVVALRRHDRHPFDDEPCVDDGLDRLTHLVFVDGRLVDAWTESVRGTPWEEAARRHDRDRRPVFEPPAPPYVRVLEWLAAVCGGPAGVAALDDAPLDDDHIDLPADLPDPRSRYRLEAAAELIDSASAALFDAETSYACRHALLVLWSEAPELVLGAPTPAHLAGGVCWAVGKANGLYGPRGVRTQASVQEALGLSQAISGQGQRVATALRGLLATATQPYGWPGVPDLLPLGRPELLVSATRRRLVHLRDRARRAEAASEGVVPSKPEP